MSNGFYHRHSLMEKLFSGSIRLCLVASMTDWQYKLHEPSTLLRVWSYSLYSISCHHNRICSPFKFSTVLGKKKKKKNVSSHTIISIFRMLLVGQGIKEDIFYRTTDISGNPRCQAYTHHHPLNSYKHLRDAWESISSPKRTRYWQAKNAHKGN